METLTDSEVVVLRLGATRYCLAMAHVAEVARPPGLTRVPGLPAWLAGVANWRGRVLAVLDLRPLLGEVAADPGRRSRLIVLRRGEVAVGLLTEGVDGTRQVAADDVEPSLSHLSASAAELLLGQITDLDGPYGVLDVDAVFRLRDGLPRARRPS